MSVGRDRLPQSPQHRVARHARGCGFTPVLCPVLKDRVVGASVAVYSSVVERA